LVVLGLETLRGPEALAQTVEQIGAPDVAFSLDLRQGVPILPEPNPWGSTNPMQLLDIAIDRGVLRIILLDLARVGTGRGTGTIELLSEIRTRHPTLEVIVGGGISGAGDLRMLSEAGATAALVGSALHDGRIGREDGMALASRSG
jgi:phosphoribosylformimino-5-aminoimidazole carboxamide ribotide isomerase